MLPSHGCINLHLGKLPAYRGIFPVFHAIVNGEDHFGVSVHFMNMKFDDGSIINQKIIPISDSDDLFSLYPEAFETGANLLVSAVKDIQNGIVEAIPNGPKGKSYYSYPNAKQIYKYHLKKYFRNEN